MTLAETRIILVGLLMSSALTVFFLFMLVPERFILNKKKDESVVVHCKTCNGTGETEQDVNLLMAKGTYSIWHSGHSYGCEEYNKGGTCELIKKKYEEIMEKYKELGPKIEKAMCPDCMGSGSYKQFKGYRVGKERE